MVEDVRHRVVGLIERDGDRVTVCGADPVVGTLEPALRIRRNDRRDGARIGPSVSLGNDRGDSIDVSPAVDREIQPVLVGEVPGARS